MNMADGSDLFAQPKYNAICFKIDNEIWILNSNCCIIVQPIQMYDQPWGKST